MANKILGKSNQEVGFPFLWQFPLVQQRWAIPLRTVGSNYLSPGRSERPQAVAILLPHPPQTAHLFLKELNFICHKAQKRSSLKMFSKAAKIMVKQNEISRFNEDTDSTVGQLDGDSGEATTCRSPLLSE